MRPNASQDIHDLGPQRLNNRYYWLGNGCEQRLDEADLTMYRSGVDQLLLNGFLRVGGGGFDRARSLAGRLGGLPSIWWVGDDSYPDLAEELGAAGATEIGDLPVMAAQVDDVPAPPVVPGLTIATVQPHDLREWVAAYGPSMGIDPDQRQASLAMEAAHPEAPERLIRFAGRMDRRMVATSALLDRGGVGGIYLVSTAEKYRRRGIGAALSFAAVAEAQRRGLKVVTLQASRPGRSVYRRLGFTAAARYRLFTL